MITSAETINISACVSIILLLKIIKFQPQNKKNGNLTIILYSVLPDSFSIGIVNRATDQNKNQCEQKSRNINIE